MLAAAPGSTATNTLLTQQMAQDAQLSQMIARLSAALAGGTGSTGQQFTIQPVA